MAKQQLYLAIGIPLLFNAMLIGVLIAYVNAKADALEARFEGKMDARFEAINTRFDDMRELWRAELHRVEEILDVRLKHLDRR